MEALSDRETYYYPHSSESLRHLLSHREVGPSYQKWIGKLVGFDFEIKYKPWARNRIVEAAP